MADRKYRMLRIVCKGKIKCCNTCVSVDDGVLKEGFCSTCGRPLWKKPEENCNTIIGYVEKEIRQQGKVNFICRNCSTVTTF